jgi:hypothetical protein
MMVIFCRHLIIISIKKILVRKNFILFDHITKKMRTEVHLVTQYYKVSNGDLEYQKNRQKEIYECLERNCALGNIDMIHLLFEDNSVADLPTTVTEHPRVTCVYLGKRMTYEDVFSYYNTCLIGKICILANSDIFFNESVDFLQHIDFRDTVIALTRYESPSQTGKESVLYGQECNLVQNNPWLKRDEIAVFSQDTWIWCQNKRLCIPNCDFFLGVTGCDNMIVRRFLQASYNVINPCNFIASIHYDFLSILLPGVADENCSDANYIEKGQVSSKRSLPIGKFKDYVFLHPSLTFPERGNPESYCITKTSYIPQENEELHDHEFRKQIYSTVYSSSLKAIWVNSCQIDFNVATGPKPLRLPITEKELLDDSGCIYVPRGCSSFEVTIHYAKYINQRDIEFISHASTLTIDISNSELRPSCNSEWKEFKRVNIPSCYRTCRRLIYRVFGLFVFCRSIRLRFEGAEMSGSKLNLLVKRDSSQSLSSWIADKSIDLMLNLSLHLDYMSVIESFDHFSCLETLNNYFHNKEPKNIKTLFELQKQNKYFYKTLGNMESFYCSYVGIKRTLLSQNITGNQRKEGNSILITIMNRTKNLLSYFDTWVHQKLLDEIIIVDWSTCDEEKQTIVDFLSSYPKYPSSLKSVLLVRVEGETDYYRTVAQNVGASFANFNKVLKLDSDISLKEDFFLMHPLCQNEFYVGDWKLARNENEKYTHGNIYLFTKDFFNINGYDERIRSYGWEDSDFTQRLELSGLEKKYLNIDSTYHNPHSNFNRICNLRSTEKSYIESNHPEVLTQANRMMLLKMSRWCHVNPRHSFTLLKSDITKVPFKRYVLSRNRVLNDFEFPEEDYKEAIKEACHLVSSWNLISEPN